MVATDINGLRILVNVVVLLVLRRPRSRQGLT